MYRGSPPAIFRALVVFWFAVSNVSAVEPAYDSRIDARGFFEMQRRFFLPEEAFEAAKHINDLERAFEDARRHASTDAMARSLDGLARKWRETARKMDAALAEEFLRARQDASVRRAANFFEMVAVAARTYDLFTAEPPADSAGAESAGGSGPDEAGGDAANPEGQAVRSTEEHVIRTERPAYIDGKWTTLPYEETVRKIIYGAAPPADQTPSPLVDAMIGHLGELAANMPSFACDSEFGGCFAIDPNLAPGPARGEGSDSAGAAGSMEAPRTLPVSISPPQRNPTSEESGLWKTLSSLALDVLPAVGTAKGGLELVTGKDPVTGESIPRVVSAAGFALSTVVPGGRLWTKVGNRLIGKAGDAGPKFIKAGETPAQLTAVGEKMVVEPGTELMHFTSRSGSKGIKETGVLKADGDGNIFAVISGSDQVGSRGGLFSPSEVEEILQIGTGKGTDVIGFSLPPGGKAILHKRTDGVEEVIIRGGNMRLPSGSEILQRTNR